MNINTKSLATIFLFTVCLQTVKSQAAWPWCITEGLEWNSLLHQEEPIKNKSQFAYEIKANLNANDNGRINTFDDNSLIWTIGINSPGAKSISLSIVPPNSGTLFVYSPFAPQDAYSYTIEEIQNDGKIHTSPIEGDAVIVEFQGEIDDKLPIIETVYHDFIGIKNKVGNVNDSETCEVNASCYSTYNDNQRAVCRIICGNSYGTATLINNTLNNGKAYLLTAAHVITNKNSFSCKTLFNFEILHCQDGRITSGKKEELTDGGTILYFNETHDIALIELNTLPPLTARAFWNGWDISDAPQPPFAVIHHPQGDVKKISFENDEIKKATYNSKTNNGNQMAEGNHWRVPKWDVGTTEGGSSGSSLLSNNKIIGTLSGGSAKCTSPVNDYFVRLNNVWNIKDDDTDVTLSSILDPNNSGITNINGAYLGAANADICNIDSGNVATLGRLTDGGGYIAGHNNIGTTAVAERFSGITSATIKGMYIVPVKSNPKSSKALDIKIWNDKNGKPNDVLASQNISVKNMVKGQPLYIKLDNTIDVSGTIYAGFEMNSVGTSDSVAVMIDTDDITDNAMFCVNGEWKNYAQVTNTNQKSTAYVGLFGSNIVKSEIEDNKYSPNISIYPRMTKDEITITAENINYVNVFNIQGILVMQTLANEQNNITINCNGLISGMYIVKVHTNNGISTEKILKL